MLYRTQQAFFFPFNPFTTSIPPPPPSTTTPLPHLVSPPIQVEQGMEYVEGALKSSFRPEMAVKRTQQQAFLDDLWAVNGQSDVSGDDLFVDDLLDFSMGGIEEGFFEAEEEEREREEDTKACSVPVFPQEQEQRAEKYKDSELSRSSFSVIDDFGSLPCSELSVPADDLADLEWLSHFVEDTYSLTYAAGKVPEQPIEHRSEAPEIQVPTKPCFTTPVQTKARSKQARTGGRVWTLGSRSLTESSSSTSSSSSCTSLSSPWLIYANPSQTADSVLSQPPPAKKQKKKKQETSGGNGGSQQPRRCSHCFVQKTPQWRTGPHGAKTLCNACGVRYKSGRLLPEYRPACSPTFSSEVHSNNHRKVLEMRQKKESEAGLTLPVQSF